MRVRGGAKQYCWTDTHLPARAPLATRPNITPGVRRRGRGVDLRHVKEVWLSLCVRTRPSFKVTPTWGDPSHTGSLTCFRPHKAHTRNRS